MFLHPVHLPSGSGVEELGRFLDRAVDRRLASEDEEDGGGGGGLSPVSIKVFYKGGGSVDVPCFFVVEHEHHDLEPVSRTREHQLLTNGNNATASGSSYQFYYPYVIVRLSATTAEALEREHGPELFPRTLSLSDQAFKTARNSNALAYIFERYVNLYERMRERPFQDHDRVVLPYVAQLDDGIGAQLPSSVADAEERLKLLLEMMQPFLAHFFTFVRRMQSTGWLIPGLIREVFVDHPRQAVATPVRVLTTDTTSSLYHNVPLRNWLTGEFTPLDQALYPLCYGITRLLAHGGSPGVLFEEGRDEPSGKRAAKPPVSMRLGPYRRFYQVFLAYMLAALKKNNRPSGSKELAELNQVYGEPASPDAVDKTISIF